MKDDKFNIKYTLEEHLKSSPCGDKCTILFAV